MNPAIKLIYPVLLPLIHDAEAYPIGSTIVLTQAEAQPLLDADVIGTPADETITGNGSGGTLPPADDQPKSTVTNPAIPAQAIAELFALAELSKDSQPNVKDTLKLVKEHATSIKTEDGTVIEAKDVKINAELRDAAWSLYLDMLPTESEGDSEQDAPAEDDNEGDS